MIARIALALAALAVTNVTALLVAEYRLGGDE